MRIDSAIDRRAASAAGARPTTSPVNTDRPSAYSEDGPIDVELGHAQQFGRRKGHQRVKAPAGEHDAEGAAGEREQQALDERTAAAMAHRGAPSEVRIATSRRRDTARASSRLAMLKQAMASSTPTAAYKTSNEVRTWPVRSSRSGTSVTPVFLLNSYCCSRRARKRLQFGSR